MVADKQPLPSQSKISGYLCRRTVDPTESLYSTQKHLITLKTKEHQMKLCDLIIQSTDKFVRGKTG